MTLRDACLINLSEYSKLPYFRDMCVDVEKTGLCSMHYITGSNVDICSYVKKADAANQYARKVWEIPSLEFVLIYICNSDRVIPFSLFNDAAQEVMKKYNILSADGGTGTVDENLAMAIILMITIGYELRKLYILRAQIAAHENKVQGNDNKNAPKRRLASAKEYNLYHIDMIDEYDDVPCRGFQFERSVGYFKTLDGQSKRDASTISDSMNELLNLNKSKNLAFLQENPAADIVQVVYATKGSGASIHSYGCFPKIA